MKLMEVRCCCRPDKLLGYLPEPPTPWASSVSFGDVTLAVSTYQVPNTDRPLGGQYETAEEWQQSMYRRGRAYKADGMSLEELQNIPQFMTAAPDYRAGDVEHAERRLARTLSFNLPGPFRV